MDAELHEDFAQAEQTGFQLYSHAGRSVLTAPADERVEQLCALSDSEVADFVADVCESISIRSKGEHVELAMNSADRVWRALVPELRSIRPDNERNKTEAQCLETMSTPRLMRRRVARIVRRLREERLLRLGVSKCETYSSKMAQKNRKDQLERNAKMLARTAVVQSADVEALACREKRGDVKAFSLLDASQKTVANPAVRFAEMITRVKGMEQYARKAGLKPIFVTLTCPSRFHPGSKAWDGSTPKEAQAHLTRVGTNIQKALKRLQGLEFMGMRVAEPHRDWCPHWHLVVWTSDPILVGQIFRQHALRDNPGERGARQYRCKIKQLSAKKGGAVGYVIKYINKNTVGGGIYDEAAAKGLTVAERDVDEHHSAYTTIEAVEAWRAAHGIRSFQFWGGGSVGIWRVLRKFRDAGEDGPLERARRAADEGDYAAFMEIERLDILELVKDDAGKAVGVACRVSGEALIVEKHDWTMIPNSKLVTDENEVPESCSHKSKGAARLEESYVQAERNLEASGFAPVPGPVSKVHTGVDEAGEFYIISKSDDEYLEDCLAGIKAAFRARQALIGTAEAGKELLTAMADPMVLGKALARWLPLQKLPPEKRSPKALGAVGLANELKAALEAQAKHKSGAMPTDEDPFAELDWMGQRPSQSRRSWAPQDGRMGPGSP